MCSFPNWRRTPDSTVVRRSPTWKHHGNILRRTPRPVHQHGIHKGESSTSLPVHSSKALSEYPTTYFCIHRHYMIYLEPFYSDIFMRIHLDSPILSWTLPMITALEASKGFSWSRPSPIWIVCLVIAELYETRAHSTLPFTLALQKDGIRVIFAFERQWRSWRYLT